MARAIHEMSFIQEAENVLVDLHRLCQKCQVLSTAVTSVLTSEDGVQPFTKTFDHHSNSADLLLSAKEGCHLCSLILRELRYAQRDGLDEKLMSFSYHLLYKFRSILDEDGQQMIWVQPLTSEVEYSVFYLRSHKSVFERERYLHGAHFEVDPSRSIRNVSTAGAACFELASSWLKECLADHTECSYAIASQRALPTRLLLLRFSGYQLKVNLILSETLPKTVQYVTLSHCWGSGSHIKLRQENIDSFLRDVALDTLSQTFVDSMMVALKMGFHYIWIDSLCILQDDPADLTKEIARMCDIYRNGVLNLAAVHASNGDGGCFVNRRAAAFQPCRVAHDGQQYWYAVPDDLPKSADMAKISPLLERAWVLQEQALAPRTLFYTAEILYWECLTGTASEQQPIMDYEFPALDSVKQNLEMVRRSQNADGSSDWHHVWWDIVSDYTKRNWTYSTDRWIAISGVADFLQRKGNETLLAGLWMGHFLHDLCWRTLQWRALQRSQRLQAPSWSWLAVDAPVVNDVLGSRFDSHKTVAKLVAAPTVPEAHLPVEDWAVPIVIEAPVVAFKCGLQDLSEHMEHVEYAMEMSKLPEWHQALSVDMRWYPDREFDEIQDLWALQIEYSRIISRHTSYYEDGEVIESYKGLVVVPAQNEHDSWYRLGYFAIFIKIEIPSSGPIPEELVPETLGEEKSITLQ